MKIVTIDGQEFELVPMQLGKKRVYELDGQLYDLKPVAKPVEKKPVRISLHFKENETGDGYDHASVYDYDTELSESQAKALATAIQQLVEYVTQDVGDSYFDSVPVVRDAKEAMES